METKMNIYASIKYMSIMGLTKISYEFAMPIFTTSLTYSSGGVMFVYSSFIITELFSYYLIHVHDVCGRVKANWNLVKANHLRAL